jgi:hypothetical protein
MDSANTTQIMQEVIAAYGGMAILLERELLLQLLF